VFNQLLTNEPTVRLAASAGVFLVMVIWELVLPRRGMVVKRRVRWTNNLAIVVLNTALIRLLFPVLAVGAALVAQTHGWGLLNVVQIPAWTAFVIAVVLLDLAIYVQHVLFHFVPAFWRLHRMHHADLEFDVTTGLRFHPIEIALSMCIKLVVVVALGAPAAAVLVLEVLLNATSMFNHSNVKIPTSIDRLLRWVVVTPDMHRVHHSVHRVETDSNFGFNVPWWDRIFGTYRAQPVDGHEDMAIGLPQFRDVRELWLDKMLAQPLRSDDS
jgi:sterol desaturase/sphingolipid hydroxylase (fatty acid hydroxylase superfamily)